MTASQSSDNSSTEARPGYSIEGLHDRTRVVTLGALVFLANLLLGSQYLPTLSYFWGLGASRLLLALLLAFLPATNCGRFRPILIVVCLGSLFSGEAALLAYAFAYLLLEIAVDTLTVELSAEQDVPMQLGFFAALRTGGLWLGLLMQNSGLPLPLGIRDLQKICLISFVLFWVVVKERKSDRQVCTGLLTDDVPPLTRLQDWLRSFAQGRSLAALINLVVVTLLAGSLARGVLPYPLLYPEQAPTWFLSVAATIRMIGLGLIWTWLIEKFGLGTQLILAALGCLACSLSPLYATPEWQPYLMGALLGGVLTSCRAVLREAHRVSASLKSSALVTVWIVGCLCGEALARGLTPKQLGILSNGCAALFLLFALASWKHYARPARLQEDLKTQRSERYGDRTLDFEAAPVHSRPARRKNPLYKLINLLLVDLPVKVFLGLTLAFFATAVVSAYQNKNSLKSEFEDSVKVFRTKLFLSAMERRLSEEMLVSRRVPTDWGHFIASNFQSEGKPLDDVDLWDKPYRFLTTGPRVVIVSAGPDRAYDTRDDIEQQVDKPSGVH